MKTLLLLRHAKSSWDQPQRQDHDRVLNSRGRRAAKRMGSFMRDQGLLPDLVLCSSAARAQETLKLWRKAADFVGEVQTHRELYLAEPAGYLEQLASLGERGSRVMCIGHNPGLEELVTLLSGAEVSLPTAALVELELELPSWAALSPPAAARLVNVWRVKELPE